MVKVLDFGLPKTRKSGTVASDPEFAAVCSHLKLKIETARMLYSSANAMDSKARDREAGLEAAAPRLVEIGKNHTRVASKIERAEKERGELSAHPLVIELAEVPDFDLELVASGIAERLLGRAKEADGARLEIELGELTISGPCVDLTRRDSFLHRRRWKLHQVAWWLPTLLARFPGHAISPRRSLGESEALSQRT